MEKTTGPSAMARLDNPVAVIKINAYEDFELRNEITVTFPIL